MKSYTCGACNYESPADYSTVHWATEGLCAHVMSDCPHFRNAPPEALMQYTGLLRQCFDQQEKLAKPKLSATELVDRLTEKELLQACVRRGLGMPTRLSDAELHGECKRRGLYDSDIAVARAQGLKKVPIEELRAECERREPVINGRRGTSNGEWTYFWVSDAAYRILGKTREQGFNKDELDARVDELFKAERMAKGMLSASKEQRLIEELRAANAKQGEKIRELTEALKLAEAKIANPIMMIPASTKVDPKLLEHGRFIRTKIEVLDGNGVPVDPKEKGASAVLKAVEEEKLRQKEKLANERAEANERWGPSDEDLLADDAGRWR